MSGYSAEQIRGCRCSSRPQVILSVRECKIANSLIERSERAKQFTARRVLSE
jgi:hypothetical protein